MTEQLAATEASKEPLRNEIKELQEALCKEQENQQTKQQEWEAEKKTLVDAKEAAMKEADSWQARLASEERHVQELEAKCGSLKQDYEASTKAAHESTQAHQQAALELQAKISALHGERDKLSAEFEALKVEKNAQRGVLSEVKEILLASVDQPGQKERRPEADQQLSTFDGSDELEARSELIIAVGRLIGLLTADVAEAGVGDAKVRIKECVERIAAMDANKKKRQLADGDAAGQPSTKRPAVETTSQLEADV